MPSISDTSAIRHLLEIDRPWAVYALGDLSPERYPNCSWFSRPDGSPALVLLFHAFDTPVLFTLGEPSALACMLDDISEQPELYLQVRPEIVPVIQTRYSVLREKLMWRMILDRQNTDRIQAG